MPADMLYPSTVGYYGLLCAACLYETRSGDERRQLREARKDARIGFFFSSIGINLMMLLFILILIMLKRAGILHIGD